MRIRQQLTLAAAAACVATALVLGGLVKITRDSAEAQQQQADSQEVARDLANLLTLTNEVAVYGGERAQAQWSLRHGQLLATVERALERRPRQLASLRELKRSLENLPVLFDKLVGVSRQADSDFVRRRKELLVERLVSETHEVVETRHRWAAEIAREQAAEQRLFSFMVLGAPTLLLAVILTLAAIVARRVLVPLEQLQSAVTAIRGGDLSARCGSAAQDELGDTARAVDAMTQSLQQQSAALQASEQRLRLIADNALALIGHIDPERRYSFVNRAFLSWFGRTEGEVVGHTVEERQGPHNYAQLRPHLDRAFAGERVYAEVELLREGRTHSMLVAYVPENDAAGGVRGVYAMLTDVTPLKRAERQLRTMMESSPLGMFLADADGRCLYVNAAWLRIAGMTLEQALGSGWTRVIHPDDRELIRGGWQRTRGSGRVEATEHRYLRADGKVVWVRGHAAELTEGEHELGRVGTVEDVTERRELDAALAARTRELSRSNAELEQFAYVASHDLQEPLRMVTSYTQLLLRRHRGALAAEAQEFLDYIADGGQRAQEMIGDLLSLARLSSQARPFEAVPLAAVFDQASALLRLAIADAGAQVTHDEPLPTVHGDRRQLLQLLQNLLANALKFRASRPPCIHVSAVREPDGWRIGVRDNGIGIEPRFQERVFVLFQRLHLRSEYAGTGIGLAVCKKVVERHGGRIGVDSALGQGSTFWFTLPDAIAAPAPAVAAAQPAEPATRGERSTAA